MGAQPKILKSDFWAYLELDIQLQKVPSEKLKEGHL